MVRVKVCGITRLEDAIAAVNAGANAIGFIFYKKSPRYITPIRASRISDALPPFVTRVGVFVNESPATIRAVAARCGLDTIQLHGEESPLMCLDLKKDGFQVIKAFRVREGFDPASTSAYRVDAFLFDTYADGHYGGTGKPFVWKVLKGLDNKTPLILSGGLTADNVQAAIRMLQPFGVDVSSGVERSPGIKDHARIKSFFRRIKAR